MNNSGTYVYVCKDCGEKRKVSRAERARSFRPTCQKCGSIRLEPVNKELIATRTGLHSAARRIAQDKLSEMPFNRKKHK